MADNQNCTHNCSTCSSNCSSRKEDFREPHHEMSKIGKVIGVVSGKGGVGKSLVSSLLSIELNRRGHNVGILDADITGPSIPKIFGVKGPATVCANAILPIKSKTFIDIMSVNLLLEDENQPVVWRGPVIAGSVKQFWTDVIWKDVDYMVVDMPPGTGDVPLTVFQTLPVAGIVIVTSPQELVSMIVAKAVNMAQMMNVPILGIVENMSYLECDECGNKMNIFGESHVDEVAKKFGLNVLAKLPLNPKIAALCDAGKLETIEDTKVSEVAAAVEKL
ncbi:MAG: Mrp/NBP35 family ATP-binding protein [Clostridia bacterium]|nr:Mrp/NBP35 family ATP-binding protein [Clostridia bacterium]